MLDSIAEIIGPVIIVLVAIVVAAGLYLAVSTVKARREERRAARDAADALRVGAPHGRRDGAHRR